MGKVWQFQRSRMASLKLPCEPWARGWGESFRGGKKWTKKFKFRTLNTVPSTNTYHLGQQVFRGPEAPRCQSRIWGRDGVKKPEPALLALLAWCVNVALTLPYLLSLQVVPQSTLNILSISVAALPEKTFRVLQTNFSHETCAATKSIHILSFPPVHSEDAFLWCC